MTLSREYFFKCLKLTFGHAQLWLTSWHNFCNLIPSQMHTRVGGKVEQWLVHILWI